MVVVKITTPFIKSYKKLPQIYKNRVKKKIKLFQNDPFHHSLHSHKLKGSFLNTFSFSVANDLRIIYYWKDERAVFVDIGTHKEVYK